MASTYDRIETENSLLDEIIYNSKLIIQSIIIKDEAKALSYETKEMMLETVKYLNKLDIQGIKIHMLHILKNTKLAEIYEKENFHVLTKEEYIDIVIEQLELLRPEIVIHRITGDPIKELLVEPSWLLKKFSVLDDIDKEMVKRDSYQGKKIQ